MKNINDYETMAKLKLTQEEREWAESTADRLIASFADLKKINTDGVEPLYTVLGLQNVLREDVTVKNISRQELLNNAPEQYDGYFQVPKTLD